MIQQTYKVLRVTAWLLVAGTVLTLFSGLFTTKYFVMGFDYATIYRIHTVIIPLVFLPLFYFHSLTGLMVLLLRHPEWNTNKVKIIAGGLWTAMFVVFLLVYSAQIPVTARNMTTIQAASIAGAQNISLTPAEIAKHNSANDCWFIISGKVYDVTSYLPYHPGGPGTIRPYCGGDATNAFATKDQGKPHSSNADNQLASYYVGDLGGQASVQKAQASNPPATNKRNRNQEWEDD
jgi:cytochrome b involved in lipid metabolism